MLGFPVDTDTEQLRQAIQTVLEAHKHIFVRFEAEGDDILQRYSPVTLDIPVMTLTDSQLAEHKKVFVRPFDLGKDVLCRIEIVKTERGVFLLLDIHHLVFDGSSLDLFIVQLCDVMEGRTVEVETYTHLNHAADEQQESIETHKAYYDRLLGACEGATELTADLPTPHECEKSAEVYRPFDMAAVEQFCREHPVTPAHLTLAATLLVFARFTGNEDLYISTVSSGRSNIRIQNTFGMFVNTLPFAAKLTDGSVIDFIKGVLAVAGIQDEATFERSIMVNSTEEITNILQAAQYLPDDYVTKKLLAIFGDIDKTEEVLRQMAEDELSTFRGMNDNQEEEEGNEDQQRGRTGPERGYTGG